MSTEYTSTALRDREDLIVLLAELSGSMAIKLTNPTENKTVDLETMFLVVDGMRLVELAAEKCPEIRVRLGFPA